MTATAVWLKCCECSKRTTETWDDRCAECWYVHSGGDQGSDALATKHAVVRDGTVHWTIA